MAIIRTEGLVLRALDFAESTQIAHFFSPQYGKFTAIARGVKRLKSRLGPRLEAFAQVEVTAYAREGAAMATLSSIELLQHWPILATDLKAYALAAIFVESIDRGSEEGKPSGEIYRLALAFLQHLNSGADADTLLIHALLRLVCLLGFAPDLREPETNLPAEAASLAVQDARPPARVSPESTARLLYFNPEEGHFAFSPPGDPRIPQLRLSAASREMLRTSMGLRLEDFAATPIAAPLVRPLQVFLVQIVQYYLEIELKSLRFLKRMIWEKE